MATYFVASGGSNTAPYDTWATAATSLGTALAAATSAGDIIAIQYDGVPATDSALAADTTYAFAADNVCLIASTNSGTSTITPTAMGTANWIGNSTTNRSIAFVAVNRKVYMYGLTLRTAGATADVIQIGGAADGMHAELEDCYFWQGNTAGSGHIVFGRSGGDANTFVKLRNCTLRFAGASQQCRVGAKLQIEGGSLSSAGTAPTSLFFFNNDGGGAEVSCEGFDLTHLTGNMVGDATFQSATVRLSRCKLGVFPPTIAAQTVNNRGSAEVFVFDCATGDTHGLMAHVNAFGTTSSDTGIYFTSGSAAQSWKITTTSVATYYTPYESPWFGYYNTGTSAITPYVEIARDVSSTPYQDEEVWMDVAAKVTSGSTNSTIYSSRMALMGSPVDIPAGAGTGSWSPGGGSPDWSGKLELASSITPAEAGHISARIVVGEPLITVYADPQIRT